MVPDIPPVTFKLNLDLDFEKINYEIGILHKARQDKVATLEFNSIKLGGYLRTV